MDDLDEIGDMVGTGDNPQPDQPLASAHPEPAGGIGIPSLTGSPPEALDPQPSTSAASTAENSLFNRPEAVTSAVPTPATSAAVKKLGKQWDGQ